jgi:hypothetical protein
LKVHAGQAYSIEENPLLHGGILHKKSDAGASLQANYMPASQRNKVCVQWRREGQPSHFQISNFEIVFNDCKAEEPSCAFEQAVVDVTFNG